MWGVPVDHKMFEDVTIAQWLWYFYNFAEDQRDGFETQRDLVEYHASFIEPEAVRKIRESREEATEVPTEEFVAGIEHFFGRKIDIPKEKKKGIESYSVDPNVAANMSEAYKRNQNVQTTPVHTDSRHWLNLDLE